MALDLVTMNITNNDKHLGIKSQYTNKMLTMQLYRWENFPVNLCSEPWSSSGRHCVSGEFSDHCQSREPILRNIYVLYLVKWRSHPFHKELSRLIGKIKHLTATVSVGFREVTRFTGSLVPKSQVPEEECCYRNGTALSLLPLGAVAVWLWSWPRFPCVSWGTLSFFLTVEKNQCYFKKNNESSWVLFPGPC